MFDQKAGKLKLVSLSQHARFLSHEMPPIQSALVLKQRNTVWGALHSLCVCVLCLSEGTTKLKRVLWLCKHE